MRLPADQCDGRPSVTPIASPAAGRRMHRPLPSATRNATKTRSHSPPTSSYHVVMLTVMYEDDMPTAEELERIVGSLLTDGCLGRDDARRVAHVLRAVAGGLKGALLDDRVSDEGFD
jgi:hypothetical protein